MTWIVLLKVIVLGLFKCFCPSLLSGFAPFPFVQVFKLLCPWRGKDNLENERGAEKLSCYETGRWKESPPPKKYLKGEISKLQDKRENQEKDGRTSFGGTRHRSWEYENGEDEQKNGEGTSSEGDNRPKGVCGAIEGTKWMAEKFCPLGSLP